jgi:hypothetical protein
LGTIFAVTTGGVGVGEEALAGAEGEGGVSLTRLDGTVTGGDAFREEEVKNPRLKDEDMVVRGQEEMWARGCITSGGMELVQIISMKCVTCGKLECSRLEVSGPSAENSFDKRG